MSHEEQLLIERYQSEIEHEDGYYTGRNISLEGYATICRMKDKTNAMLDRRLQAAKAVIDLIAERVGINPQDTGFFCMLRIMIIPLRFSERLMNILTAVVTR